MNVVSKWIQQKIVRKQWIKWVLYNQVNMLLLFLYVQMLVMDRLQVTRCIRKLGNPQLSSVSILAMAANAFDENKKEAFDSGMDGFITKSIVIEDLIQELRRASK